MPKFFTALILMSFLPLIACTSQEQADAKMVKGCKAAVSSLISPKEIIEVKKEEFSFEKTQDDGKLRSIALTIFEKDGWIEIDKTYSCLFLEQWGFMKTSHKALIIQVDIDGEITGKVDGRIQGGFDEFLKLTETIDKAMGQ